ncbi:TonB-dependent receptor [Alkalispirochaeta alkalica]|uniref:TonB-dependent receptor n=1 Tax=Alkalispirochaeta alkalica TaxID=46356 RepID=UPI0003817A75|nr:TonB-dependent receptor [Alkalispirochaeta alkalica]
MTRACATRALATCVLLGLAAGAPPPRASETRQNSNGGDPPSETIVTARAPDSDRRQTPGVVVLELEKHRQEGAVTAADVVRRVPGVILQRQGSGFESSSVRIRGSDSEQVILLRDGRPILDGRTSLADLSRISLEGIERIEIILGPATALYGVGGAAGAINLISADSSGEPPGIQGTTRGIWGSFGEYRLETEASRIQETDTGRITYTVAAAGTYAENSYSYTRAGSEETRENAGGEEGSLRLQVKQQGKRHHIGIETSFSHFSRGLPGTIEFPAVSAELQEDQTSLRVHGKISEDGSKNSRRWSITGDAGLSRSDRTYQDRDYPLGALKSDSSLTLLHGSITLATPLGPVSLGLPLMGRWEFLDDTALGERDRTLLGAGPSLETVLILKNRSEVNLNLQARAELSSQEDEHLLPSFRAAGGWNAAARPLWIGVSLSRGYRLPDFSELFLEQSAFAVGNPHLDPERSQSVEAELRWGGLAARSAEKGAPLGPLSSKTGVRIALHRTTYEDLIQWLPDPNGFWRPRNTGSALIYGGEVDLSCQVPLGLSAWTFEGELGGELLQALDRNTGVTYNKQLPYRSELSFNSSAGLAHMMGHRFSLSATSRGARPVTRQNTVWLDPYISIDASCTVALRPHRAYLGISLRNALDEEYIETRFYPNPGREVRISLEVRW